jgi:hypothetical protein
MTETLFNEMFINREFGSQLFGVGDLLKWALSKSFPVPNITLLKKYEFVQIECVLNEATHRAANITRSEALAIVMADDFLKKQLLATEQPAFLIGGNAEIVWRNLIRKAIDSEELIPLDFGSKLPVEEQKNQEISVAEIDFTLLASRSELITAFGKFTDMNQEWFHNLNDTPNLRTARKILGTSGRKNSEPLFCPFEVMQWLINPKRKKGRQLSEATGWRVFKNHFRLAYNAKAIGDPNDD